MTYDDWKTTDPNDALHCENGHYMCPARCPVCGECIDSCDHDADDDEPAPPATGEGTGKAPP